MDGRPGARRLLCSSTRDALEVQRCHIETCWNTAVPEMSEKRFHLCTACLHEKANEKTKNDGLERSPFWEAEEERLEQSFGVSLR